MINTDSRHWQSLTINNDSQHWQSTLTINTDSQHWQSTLTVNTDSQHWQSSLTVNTDNQHWQSTLTMNSQCISWTPCWRWCRRWWRALCPWSSRRSIRPAAGWVVTACPPLGTWGQDTTGHFENDLQYQPFFSCVPSYVSRAHHFGWNVLYISGVHQFWWDSCLCDWFFFFLNPTIEVVTFSPFWVKCFVYLWGSPVLVRFLPMWLIFFFLNPTIEVVTFSPFWVKCFVYLWGSPVLVRFLPMWLIFFFFKSNHRGSHILTILGEMFCISLGFTSFGEILAYVTDFFFF